MAVLTQANEQGPLSPVVVGGYVLLSAQAAVIGTTALFASAPPGLYRANVSLILTTTGTSGNLVANILTTDDLQAETIAAATISAITATSQSNGVVVFENNATQNISYSTTNSGTFGSARYSLYIVLERIF
jgi:hypothetical protein